MPTISEIIQIAEISQPLAANDIAKRGLYGGGIDRLLPRKIYMVRKNVQWLYNLDPTDDTLIATSNLLYALCAPYNSIASQYLGVSGGSVAPITPAGDSTIFPIYITNSDFDSATTYEDERLSSQNIIVFFNEINRYLIPGSEFSVTGNILTILTPGFDATSNIYNLVIEKYSAGV